MRNEWLVRFGGLWMDDVSVPRMIPIVFVFLVCLYVCDFLFASILSSLSGRNMHIGRWLSPCRNCPCFLKRDDHTNIVF